MGNSGSELLKACSAGDLERVQSLVSQGVNVNFSHASLGLSTGLHEAANSGNIDCARLLIVHRADVNKRNMNGETPLMLACAKDNIEFAKLLVLQKASVNTRSSTGGTALINAVGTRNVDLVRHLLDSKAKVAGRDSKGRSALEYAELMDNKEVTDLIAEHDFYEESLTMVREGPRKSLEEQTLRQFDVLRVENHETEPVRITVKRIEGIGEVLFCVEALESDEKEYQQDMSTIYDIHPCVPDPTAVQVKFEEPCHSKTNSLSISSDYVRSHKSTEEEPFENFADLVQRNQELNQAALSGEFVDEDYEPMARKSTTAQPIPEQLSNPFLSIPVSHRSQGEKRETRTISSGSDAPMPFTIRMAPDLPEKGRRFCVLLRRGLIHKCDEDDPDSMTFEAADTEQRNQFIMMFREHVKEVAKSQV